MVWTLKSQHCPSDTRVPGSPGQKEDPASSTAPSSARCLGLWEQTGTLETKKGAWGGAEPTLLPLPLVPCAANAPARCTLPSEPNLVPGQVGPGWALHLCWAQRVKGTDTAPLGTSLLGPRVDLVPSVTSPSPSPMLSPTPVMCLGLPLPPISATGAGTLLHYRGARGSLSPNAFPTP